MSSILSTLGQITPLSISRVVGGYIFDRNMRKQFPSIQDSWRLFPAPPIMNANPIVNDHIIDKLTTGEIESVHGIKRFLEGNDIELLDGTVLKSIDSVICATGFGADYSYLSAEANSTNYETTEWDASPHRQGSAYPRLYHGLFTLKYSDSLAFIGPVEGHSYSAFCDADLSSQAIAQIWKGNFSLPTQAEKEAWCDKNYQQSLKLLSQWRIVQIRQDSKELERWLNEAAGNSDNQILSSWTTLAAWKFWWNEHKTL